jgi:hypothetical protein
MVRKWLFRGVLVAMVVATVGCKVTVTPNKAYNWFFLNEGANGTGHYTQGPGTPPSGTGSALLTVDGTGREAVATTRYQGLVLSTVTNLQYSTYQAFSGSPNEAPNLEFDVDYDSSDATTAYQGRLVFVPSVGGSITPNAWQTWNTLNGTPSGAWYSTGSGGSAYRPIVGGTAQANPPCTQASYCTWGQVMADYPNATVRPTTGLFLVRVGGPITGGFSAAVDNVTVGVNGNDLTFDFEPGTGNIIVNAATSPNLDFGFASESGTGNSGGFVTGPAGSDGTGSAHLVANGTTGSEGISTGEFAGTAVSRFSTLSYETYVTAGSNAPTLQFDADYDSSDASTAYQGRLVFEPSLSGGAAVADNTWQTWNPLTAMSGWWSTGTPIVGGSAVTATCTQATP